MSSSIQAYFKSHPAWPKAHKVIQTLADAGHEVVLAGGCVRDALLNRKFHDFDVATSATPDQVEALFEKTVAIGKAFGVIMVVQDGQPIEVATFRGDGEYSDGRRPDQIHFVAQKEDAVRRDFTVNALFYDTQKSQVIDYVEGQKDLALKVIRCVGVAEKRFSEDRLRLLRAVRFATQLDFKIEEQTWNSLIKMSKDISQVARERQMDELRKMSSSPYVARGWQLLVESGLIKSLLHNTSDLIHSEHKKWFEALVDFSQFQNPPPLFVQLAWIYFRLSDFKNSQMLMADLKTLKATKDEMQGAQQFLNGLEKLKNSQTTLAERLQVLDGIAGLWLIQFWPLSLPDLNQQTVAVINSTVERFKKIMDANGRLPKPVVRGEDLQRLGVPAGAKMGQLLARAYDLQICNDLTQEQILGMVFAK